MYTLSTDKLLEILYTKQKQIEQLQEELAEANKAVEVLNDPDKLADYVNWVFGPDGPYPTETKAEQVEREMKEREEALKSYDSALFDRTKYNPETGNYGSI